MIGKEQIDQVELLNLISESLRARIGEHKISIEGGQFVVTYQGRTRRRWIAGLHNVHIDAREYAQWFENDFTKPVDA